MQSISAAEAVPLLAAEHYLGGAPSNATTCFGVYESGALVAAALYGPLHMPRGHASSLQGAQSSGKEPGEGGGTLRRLDQPT